MGHILAFAAKESFISLYGTRKHPGKCFFLICPSFSNSMGKKPSSLLCYAKISM